MKTHQFEPVCAPIPFDKRPNVPVLHELRHDFVPFTARIHRHYRTDKWKDIRVDKVLPYNHFFAKNLQNMRTKVNATSILLCNQITDHRELSPFPLVIRSIEFDHFDDDFTAIVLPDPYCRTWTAVEFRNSLGIQYPHRFREDPMPPTKSGQVAHTRRSVLFIQRIRFQNLLSVRSRDYILWEKTNLV